MNTKIRTKILVLTGLVLLIGAMVSTVYSHCQIPCGIYDDQARLNAIGEHITTIEKSMKQITELSQAEKVNSNQVVRWVNNKEHHADELAEIVTYYFMAQRVKPIDNVHTAGEENHKKYLQQLSLLHEMLVTSMKCKQTTDLAHVEKLKDRLDQFKQAYH